MCVSLSLSLSLPLSAGTVAMALEEERHREHEGGVRHEKRSLKVELKEMELAHQDAMKALKMVSRSLQSLLAHLHPHCIHHLLYKCHSFELIENP